MYVAWFEQPKTLNAKEDHNCDNPPYLGTNGSKRTNAQNQCWVVVFFFQDPLVFYVLAHFTRTLTPLKILAVAGMKQFKQTPSTICVTKK